MQAPVMKVIPEVLQTNSSNRRAMSTHTGMMVPYSVFMKVLAPERMMPAISIMSLVPSSIFLIRK